jgi:galacturan 1,4-alpha-galacturonidase
LRVLFARIPAMRASAFAALAALAHLAAARLTCVVNGLGGGQDDGPNILTAFNRCGKNGKITLAGYYSVDTLLLTTGLDNVEIELSGTRASCLSPTCWAVLIMPHLLSVQYTPNIAKWSPQSYFLSC